MAARKKQQRKGKTVDADLADAILRMPGSGKLVWWPNEHGSAKLAWEVTICALKPLGDFHTVVDAETGRVLLQKNRICFATGSGNVFQAEPISDEGWRCEWHFSG
jgi:hypothetical protein